MKRAPRLFYATFRCWRSTRRLSLYSPKRVSSFRLYSSQSLIEQILAQYKEEINETEQLLSPPIDQDSDSMKEEKGRIEAKLKEMGLDLEADVQRGISAIDMGKKQTELQEYLGLNSLQFFELYPKKLKNLVIDVLTPRGRWDRAGNWVEDPPKNDENPLLALEKSVEEGQQAFVEQRKVLPEDLQGNYRFGVTEDELKAAGASDKLRDVLSFHNATSGEIKKFRVEQAIKKFQRRYRDTGSPAVQIAALTIKIRHLQDHLRQGHKDQPTRRALQRCLTERRGQMKYLKKRKPAEYYNVISEYGIPDIVFELTKSRPPQRRKK